MPIDEDDIVTVEELQDVLSAAEKLSTTTDYPSGCTN